MRFVLLFLKREEILRMKWTDGIVRWSEVEERIVIEIADGLTVVDLVVVGLVEFCAANWVWCLLDRSRFELERTGRVFALCVEGCWEASQSYDEGGTSYIRSGFQFKLDIENEMGSIAMLVRSLFRDEVN